MSGIHRLRPGAESIAAATGAPAVSLGDGVWMSSGLSNSYLVETDDGRVVVNTGMGFEGPMHRRAFDAIGRSPTTTVLLTQGHFDHVGGVDCFLEDGTELVAQGNFASWRADNERLQAFRSRNAAFAWMDAIMAAVEHAKALGEGAGSQSRPEPTLTFDQSLELRIGGRDLVLLSVPGGETTDSMVVWIPDARTVLTGNLFGPLFGHVPNLVTMRGDRYRDALEYCRSLDVVLALDARRVITGHFEPIDDADTIAEEIVTMRDAMLWVHDQTVDGMNSGADVHTLMRDIRLPESFDLGEGYGKTTWNVRAIWENYSGWFHHRSTTELYEVAGSEVSGDIVAAAGASALVDAARRRLSRGEPVAALLLTDIVLDAYAHDAAAREVAAQATRSLLAASSNFWESAWLRRALERLGG
jgi:alkyl sulfatase BDS1-like metallo-beta-lactamase superfamily hydrolase